MTMTIDAAAVLALRARVVDSASDSYRSLPHREVAELTVGLNAMPAADVFALLEELGRVRQRTKRDAVASIRQMILGTYQAYVANLV